VPIQPRVQIEGLTELRRTLRRMGGPQLQRELGQVHRRIGELVIASAGGSSTGVGAGRGETIRPSAATREVQLRVGGGHRDARSRQWGYRQVWPGGQAPARPHLIAAARSVQPRIEEAYLSGVESIVRGNRLGWSRGAGLGW